MRKAGAVCVVVGDEECFAVGGNEIRNVHIDAFCIEAQRAAFKSSKAALHSEETGSVGMLRRSVVWRA